MGWVIPTSVVTHFLLDYQRNSKYTGFPMLGVQWQRMESDALKRHMHMNVRPPTPVASRRRGDVACMALRLCVTASRACVVIVHGAHACRTVRGACW